MIEMLDSFQIYSLNSGIMREKQGEVDRTNLLQAGIPRADLSRQREAQNGRLDGL